MCYPIPVAERPDGDSPTTPAATATPPVNPPKTIEVLIDPFDAFGGGGPLGNGGC
jgi:hypothetical protein